jgi:DNA gyrase subunit A
VRATLPVRSFEEAAGDFVLLGTPLGTVKKTPLSAYANPRRGGIIAIHLGDDDELIAALRTNGSQQVLIATRQGKAIRFPEEQVRSMGRTAAGVRGVSLRPEDAVVGMEILSPGATILTATQNGYGKRTPLDDYRVQGRGGQGVITIRTSARNGPVVSVAQVLDDDEVMFITDAGQTLRCRVSTISTMGRAVQGVRLMDLSRDEKVVSMARLAERDVGEGNGGEPGAESGGEPGGDAGAEG